MDESEITTIYQLLKARAARSPDATAIASPGCSPLTFDRLIGQVDRVVRSLRAIGVGRDDCVAIVLPNGLEMAVAFLGACGAATAAPLNPAYREGEFDYYLSDLNAKALIVQAGADTPALVAARKQEIPVLPLSPGFLAEADGNQSPRFADTDLPTADDVALLLYTSGTTSKPKQVPLTHRNLLTSARNIKASLGLETTDRCLNLMPLYHIHGLVGALLSSLTAGAGIVVTPPFDSAAFFGWLRELQPTWYTAVPTIHQAIVGAGKERAATMQSAPLRLIRSCSAPLPIKVMAELEELFKVPVIEAYGMTEAAHQIASNPLPPRKRKAGSVGVPTGPEVGILSEAGKLLPSGQTGEIVVRGANLTPGYNGNSRANEEAFTDGWFRTGDQGYLDTDGYLFLTGRLKDIINRGGEKISPHEIDKLLMDHPDISQAAAFRVPHPSLGEDIAAAIVARDHARLTETSIREYLLARIAEFKVPSRLLIVEEIPKGATGKVNRAELAEKFAASLTNAFAAPDNAVEATVARIYADVLRTEQVGSSDSFFALGGDSLRATQIINRIRAEFKLNLPVATIFQKATVSDLAREITKAKAAESISQARPSSQG